MHYFAQPHILFSIPYYIIYNIVCKHAPLATRDLQTSATTFASVLFLISLVCFLVCSVLMSLYLPAKSNEDVSRNTTGFVGKTASNNLSYHVQIPTIEHNRIQYRNCERPLQGINSTRTTTTTKTTTIITTSATSTPQCLSLRT